MSLCVDLEKHFKFVIFCNQTFQATFEFVIFSDYLLVNKKYRDFDLPFSICLSKLFCDSFKTASLSLFPFDKMVNIEEKSRMLNFQRFHFPMELQATQFL